MLDPLSRWRRWLPEEMQGSKEMHVGLPTFAALPYTEEPDDLEGVDVAIVGAPYDNQFDHPGARYGPRAIRAAGHVGTAHPEVGIDPLEAMRVIDYGDAPIIQQDGDDRIRRFRCKFVNYSIRLKSLTSAATPEGRRDEGALAAGNERLGSSADHPRHRRCCKASYSFIAKLIEKLRLFRHELFLGYNPGIPQLGELLDLFDGIVSGCCTCLGGYWRGASGLRRRLAQAGADVVDDSLAVLLVHVLHLRPIAGRVNDHLAEEQSGADLDAGDFLERKVG